MDVLKLILVRHGETKANAHGIYSGWTNYDLTSKGEAQIKKVAELLKDEDIDIIYSSPLQRALTTAKAIAERLNKEIVTNEKMKEFNFGIFEGKTNKEISTQFKKEYENWTSDYINYRIPQGECLKDLYDRVNEFINDLKSSDKTYLIVTHGGIIQAVITILLDIDLNKIWSFRIRPGCLVEIEWNDGIGILNKLLNI